MADETATITLTVPSTPTVSDPEVTYREETPVYFGVVGTIPAVVPTVNVSTSILAYFNYTEGLLKIVPVAVGYVAITDNCSQYWFQWGSNIVIEPVSATVSHIKVFFAGYPETELAAGSDSPDELPEEFHRSIVDFACYVLAMRLKKWGQASKFHNAYVRNLTKRKREYIIRNAEKRGVKQTPDNVKMGGIVK